jgi:hypothetical protein
MSNPLAISAVTAAFGRRLLAAANAAVPAAKVRTGPPTAKLSEDGKPLVNLHLFRVAPNAAHNNNHLPNRTGAGLTRGPSKLALDLHYVVTFYGDHDAFEVDFMLGQVMIALEAEPLLTRATVAGAIDENDELEDSDLGEANARLRVTRQLMTLDDFSKIWSIFYQVPYAVSLVYEVSHVIIESDDASPLPLPVARRQLWVSPLSSLRLDSAGGPDGALPVWGGTLVVKGFGLARTGIELEADGTAVALGEGEQVADEIRLPLSDQAFGTTLKVGIHRLQAVEPPVAGKPAHLRARSNVIPFALHPQIRPGDVDAPAGGTTATGTIDVTVEPEIASEQAIRLLLDSRDPLAPRHVALAGREPADAQPAETDFTFDFTDLPRGNYLVRVDVDGLVSPVALDAASGEISGPVVTI